VCCSVLQCAAVCCNILQCVTECCSELLRVAVCCSVLQCVEIVPGRPSSGTTVLPILFLVKPLHCICSNTLSPVHGHDSFICVRRYTYRLIHTYDMTLCVCPILFFCEALVLYMQQHLVARIWTWLIQRCAILYIWTDSYVRHDSFCVADTVFLWSPCSDDSSMRTIKLIQFYVIWRIHTWFIHVWFNFMNHMRMT